VRVAKVSKAVLVLLHSRSVCLSLVFAAWPGHSSCRFCPLNTNPTIFILLPNRRVASEEHLIMNTGDSIESKDPVESRNPVDSADLIDKQFTDGFNHVHDLFLADRLQECEEAAFALLKEEAIPRYHKMRTLILLGTIVGDWDEANRYHIAAEGMWRIVRRYHPVGDDEGVEKAIAELRELLDELDAALRDDEPSEYDFINAVEDAVEKHDADMEDIAEEDDADVEDARAEMDHLDFKDAAAIPSLNTQAPADEPQSPAKKVCISAWLTCTFFSFSNSAAAQKPQASHG
jgi:hypothetical protein